MNVMALSRKQEILFMDCKIANSTEVFSETQINTDFRGLFFIGYWAIYDLCQSGVKRKL